MSGRTVGTWILIYVTLFKSIRKASKVISRDRVGYHCSQQTKRCFDNQFYKKIELLCFEGGNKGGGNYADNELGISSCKDRGTYRRVIGEKLTRLLHDGSHGRFR